MSQQKVPKLQPYEMSEMYYDGECPYTLEYEYVKNSSFRGYFSLKAKDASMRGAGMTSDHHLGKATI